VQKLALELRLDWTRATVDVITDDGMTDEREMDPDLMRTAGLDRDLEERSVLKSLDYSKMSHCRAS
jgi:hypothetical protein